MRRLDVAETEALIGAIQKASGLNQKSFERVRRSVENKIKAAKRIGKIQRNKAQTEKDIYQIDPSDTIEMHLFKVVFEKSERKINIVEQAFREYQEALGYWKTLDDQLVKQMIQNDADKSYKYIGKSKVPRYQGKPTFVESALKYSVTKLYQPVTVEKTHLRAFRNGTVNLKTGQISPHKADDYLTSYIPYDYAPGADCPAALIDYVSSSMGIDALDSVRAAISMVLDPTAPNKFIHVVGPSGSGKGVLGKTIASMFGPESVKTDNNFKKLAEPDQRHQYLQGCSFFYVDDIVDYVGGEIAAFYTLVERTPMSGRSLFSSKAYNTVFNTRYLVCSTGPIPIKSSASKGLTRRVFPLPTKSLSVDPDPTIETRLQECIADIISWALAMPKDYRNAIINNPSQYNESTARYLEDSDLSSNSVRAFADNCLMPIEPTGSLFPPTIEVGNLYEHYRIYCFAMGLKAMGQPTFVNQLKQAIPAHFVAKHEAKKGEESYIKGERTKVPSKWLFLSLYPSAFNTETIDEYDVNSRKIIKLSTAGMAEGNLYLFKEWAAKYQSHHPYAETLRNSSLGSLGRTDVPRGENDGAESTENKGKLDLSLGSLGSLGSFQEFHANSLGDATNIKNPVSNDTSSEKNGESSHAIEKKIEFSEFARGTRGTGGSTDNKGQNSPQGTNVPPRDPREKFLNSENSETANLGGIEGETDYTFYGDAEGLEEF